MSDIEPSRDAEFFAKFRAEIELVESLFGPLGAVLHYVRERMCTTLLAVEAQGVLLRDLADGINRNPLFGALVVRALEAARRSGLRPKAQALGDVIAEGFRADDDTEISERMLIVQTIDQLETLHIEALEVIRAAEKYSAGVDEVTEKFGPAAAGAVIAILRREGLVPNDTITWGLGGAADKTRAGELITPYGERVRAYLLAAADG